MRRRRRGYTGAGRLNRPTSRNRCPAPRNLEALAARCAALGRHEFLFAAEARTWLAAAVSRPRCQPPDRDLRTLMAVSPPPTAQCVRAVRRALCPWRTASSSEPRELFARLEALERV